MCRYKRYLILIAASLLMALYWSCGTENPLAPTRGENEVWIQANGYDPATINISAGEQVRWVNKDNVTHDVTSGVPTNVTTAFPPSIPLNANETHSVTFQNSGSFPYFCTVHTSKTGTIIVQ